MLLISLAFFQCLCAVSSSVLGGESIYGLLSFGQNLFGLLPMPMRGVFQRIRRWKYSSSLGLRLNLFQLASNNYVRWHPTHMVGSIAPHLLACGQTSSSLLPITMRGGVHRVGSITPHLLACGQNLPILIPMRGGIQPIRGSEV